jgi:hypothetical protein
MDAKMNTDYSASTPRVGTSVSEAVELPALPDPDPALLQLDAIAQEFSHWEYGLPFMGEGVLCNEPPLSELDEHEPVLDKLRQVLRAYATEAVRAERNKAANLVMHRLWDSEKDNIAITKLAADIRKG